MLAEVNILKEWLADPLHRALVFTVFATLVGFMFYQTWYRCPECGRYSLKWTKRSAKESPYGTVRRWSVVCADCGYKTEKVRHDSNQP